MSAELETNSNLYDALSKEMSLHNLSWEDIESVVVADYAIEETTGEAKILTKDEATEILRKSRLMDIKSATDSDNLPFYAYTRNRIFYISDDMGQFWIGSIPRNPSDQESPQSLPK